jgi:hypothetical protein
VLGGREDRLDLARVGVGIGGRARPVDGQIAGRLRPQLRRAVAQRFARIDHRRQLLVLDGNELGGVLRGRGSLGDHHGDRLADMHDALGRQGRPERHHQRLAAAAGQGRMPADAADAFEILGGEHADHAGRLGGGLNIDADDVRERVRRAHEIRISLVRQRRIGDVAPVPAHQGIVLDPAVKVGAVGVGMRDGVHCGSGSWHGGSAAL